MKYQRQLVFPHRPVNNQHGDCFRTCVACMLDMDAADVPNFAENDASTDEFWGRIQDWFAGLGLYLLCVPLDGAMSQEDVLTTIGTMNPGCRYMLGGHSPGGTSHVVVCLDEKMEWDPSPVGSGLDGPTSESGDEKLWWVYMIGSKV